MVLSCPFISQLPSSSTQQVESGSAGRLYQPEGDQNESNQQHAEEHEQILREMADQFEPVFDQSPFGVYLYVDDVNKICNERMARMHGMTVEEWRNTPTFLNDFIAEEDREMYARNYRHHVAGLRHPVTFRFRGLRKDGSTFAAETDMIPLCWRGHPVAYHFVHEISSGD